ncbi:YobI family P-loop NTPase [Holdemania massiliensis]|uniref:YobI family P-loop NTPase n=1 Tax=Holdemania massiliensis TaxID=1468449 RepID=UPI0035207DB9
MAERTHHFERLTPIDNMDLDVYEEAIDYTFDNSDIKNVAISGAYSAGKSSVLASYKKKHSDLHFLHISLAHFKSPDPEDETGVKESVLEGKILNQLIHQIPSEKIPQTNFRVKRKVSAKSVIKLTIEVVLFFIVFIHFACFDLWKSYVNTLPNNWFKSILTLSTHQYALMVDGILMVTQLLFIVYGIIRVQMNKNVFRKLNLQGNEIEIFEESDDSYFDKYLNEVLYLFENADADVIVFEDMDRFNANKIFERLREINTLANIQLQKEEKKVLRFFYLLRDDIFVSKDRTKFFDYIVPVVPVVDNSNSYDQFISHFKKDRIFEKFDESFLQGLSLYIDDMRLLKNIYNEFVIYFNRLNIIELDCNKMLAIIAYKNLFPRDFADLQLNQGFVYTLFSKKDNIIEAEITEMRKAIDERKQRISSSKKEHLVSLRELNAVFADKYLKGYSLTQKDDKDLSDFVMRYLSENHKSEYMSRKQILDDKLNGDKLHQEILNLEQNVIEIKNKQLHQIITRDNIDTIFTITSTNEIGDVTDFNEIKSSEYFNLLKYLIRNGYIDETYADYMTYFYENSLSRVDKTYLRSITDKRAKEYTYKLKDPKLVFSRLRLVDFDQEEILNFDLFTYLLQTSHIDYTVRLINQLKDTKNFKFIGAYFDTTVELSAYIKYLNMSWSEVFSIALSKRLLTENQIRRYSIFSLYYSDDDIIELVNKENCLCDYISNARDYLAIDNPDIDRLIHCFTLLEVCFIDFDYAELNKDLFRAVYEKSLYEINTENLQLIQREILEEKNEEDFFHKNYTLLYSHPDSSITQYVNRNVNEYFEVVLQISGGTILDDEKVVIAILNNSDLTIEHKQSYISALRTTIASIKEIEDSSLWASLLNADVVQYSECNMMDCFNTMKLNKSVISYINRCDTDLDFTKTEYDEDTKEKLFDSVILCNDINNSKYKQILVSLEFFYDNFDIAEISDDKITILIDTNIIRMTADNLKFMRENYLNLKFYFIRKNIEKYIDIMEDTLFSQEELLEILIWDISDELKIQLFEFSDDEISIIGKNYSPVICLHILNNNFSESDLSELFSSFEQWDDSIQVKIFDYAVKNIESIMNNPISVSEKLKNNLIHSDKVSRDKKIDFLIAIMPELSRDSIKEILTLLDLTDYLKIFDTRSRPKFEINDENKKLLTAFKENNLIDSYQENPEKEGYYKIIKFKSVMKTLPQELL